MNLNLGKRRGNLSDWITQRWVQAIGRKVAIADFPCFKAPSGGPDAIGVEFFHRWSEANQLTIVESPGQGLMEQFAELAGPEFEATQVHPEVSGFYERTSDYAFDVWSEWTGVFKPFGWLLAVIFSRRLQQLNVPLSPLETSKGVKSRVLRIQDANGEPLFAAWVRESLASGLTIYAGCYSICQMPGFDGICVKVAFPLPNGFALVVMKPESGLDGSLTLRSEGKRFGDPGFYFFVEDTPERGWACYIASLHESIRVYVDEASVLRADHVLKLWGVTFLRLHYRMSAKTLATERDTILKKAEAP